MTEGPLMHLEIWLEAAMRLAGGIPRQCMKKLRVDLSMTKVTGVKVMEIVIFKLIDIVNHA